MKKVFFLILGLSLTGPANAGLCDTVLSVADRARAQIMVGSPATKGERTYYRHSPRVLTEKVISMRNLWQQKHEIKYSQDPLFLNMPLGDIAKPEMAWMAQTIRTELSQLGGSSARGLLLESLMRHYKGLQSSGFPYGKYLRFGMVFTFAFVQSKNTVNGISAKSAQKVVDEFMNEKASELQFGVNVIKDVFGEEINTLNRLHFLFLFHHGDVPMDKFNRFRDTPIRFVGLSDRRVSYDGQKRSGIRYLKHDMSHAIYQNAPNFMMADEGVFKYIGVSESFYRRLDERLVTETETMRRAVEYVLFSATHEHSITLWQTASAEYPNKTHLYGARFLSSRYHRLIPYFIEARYFEAARQLIKDVWRDLDSARHFES